MTTHPSCHPIPLRSMTPRQATELLATHAEGKLPAQGKANARGIFRVNCLFSFIFKINIKIQIINQQQAFTTCCLPLSGKVAAARRLTDE